MSTILKEVYIQKKQTNKVKEKNCDAEMHQISPHNITPESHVQIMRIKEMINNERSLWLVNKFSLSLP